MHVDTPLRGKLLIMNSEKEVIRENVWFVRQSQEPGSSCTHLVLQHTGQELLLTGHSAHSGSGLSSQFVFASVLLHLRHLCNNNVKF